MPSSFAYRMHFDCDADSQTTETIFNGLIPSKDWLIGESDFEITNTYAYFGVDFENYFRTSIEEYSDLENSFSNDYKITSKPGKAKAVAQNTTHIPEFVQKLDKELRLIEIFGQ